MRADKRDMGCMLASEQLFLQHPGLHSYIKPFSRRAQVFLNGFESDDMHRHPSHDAIYMCAEKNLVNFV